MREVIKLNNWTEQEVQETVSLMTRKTINDFKQLELKEKDELHRNSIINNLTPEDEQKHKYLIDEDVKESEIKNLGTSKGYMNYAPQQDQYIYNNDKTLTEAKELYKYNEIYQFSKDYNIDFDKNLDYQYVKNNMILNHIENDNTINKNDLYRMEKMASDELYYPNLRADLNNNFSEIYKEIENENKKNKEFVRQNAEDIYLGIYHTKNDYSKEYDISEDEIERLYTEYDLDIKFKNIEYQKLEATPDLNEGIDKENNHTSKEYEKYVEKYYDTKNNHDFVVAGSYLANRNLYNKVSDELNSERFNKEHLKEEVKDKEEVNRLKEKDDEKIKRLKQDELYSKLIKQMQKNDLYINSVNSNIAYKSRANSESLSHSSAQLESRDTMQKQTTIDKTENNVRSTINDTRTDNKIHNKKERKENKRDDDLER